MYSTPGIQFPTMSFSTPLSQAHKQLLINLEGITNRVGNNYVKPEWGSSDGRGRYIGFQTRFINPDGTERTVKNSKHGTISRWINPEHADYDSSFSDQVLMTGHYKTGFQVLPIYTNIEQILRFLECTYNLEVNRTPERCFSWPHAYNTYEKSMSSKRYSLLKTIVMLYAQVCNTEKAWSQSSFPITYRLEDGTDSKRLSKRERGNIDVIMSGRLVSGTNVVEIYYNINAALCYLEGSMGLRIDS